MTINNIIKELKLSYPEYNFYDTNGAYNDGKYLVVNLENNENIELNINQNDIDDVIINQFSNNIIHGYNDIVNYYNIINNLKKIYKLYKNLLKRGDNSNDN